MHVDAEVAQENPRVVLGMFLVNPTPASVLFVRTMCGSRTDGWSLPCVMSD
jgi:hypothetical protein